jgi:hypothetical protein
MKYLKRFNEGFFDFLKKKEKVKVTFDDVMECLYDLTDEHRIKNKLNGDRLDGLFTNEDDVFNKIISYHPYNQVSMNDELFRDKKFIVRKNAIAFRMIYNPSEISDEEVNELLLDCKSKLEMYGCDIKFFIAWGRSEGSSSDKEWNDFMRMIEKTISKTHSPMRPRNITIKIESPNGFN